MGVESTCPYCGVGCGVSIQTEGEELIALSGSSAHPANRGKLCVKGTNLPEALASEDRLLRPRVDGLVCDWTHAIDETAGRLRQIIETHGTDAIAFYVSGQILTEDYYVANKLMKGCLESGNIDTNSRLCMASAVAGYRRAFGGDAVPCSYDDLEQADLILITGSNAAWAHPILYQRMALAKRRRNARVVILDPRLTATSQLADLCLTLKPGTDAAVFNFLLKHCHDNGVCDSDYIQRHTEGFDAALEAAHAWTLERTAEFTGLSKLDLSTLAEWVAKTPRFLTFYSQGINQSSSGTDKANAIINLHLATGRLGSPGCGPFSITGQPNAMGGREVGGLANQLAAHMVLESTEDRDRVQRFWGTPGIAQKPGLKAVDLFEAIHQGSVKAVWIMATNPVISLPDANRVKEALEKCELVIVSDVQESSDTLALADIALPATPWGEKDGTVTNSERCISRQRAWKSPMGDSKADWWIITQVARAMGYESHFPYECAADVFREHARLSAFENKGSRAFDISGLADISNEDYNNLMPIKWPVNSANPDGCERLFEDGRFFTPSGKAQCIAITPRLPVAQTTSKYPLLLNSGRLRDQWHTMTRTGFSTALGAHRPEPSVNLNPLDASRHDLVDGQIVEVHNPRASCHMRLQIDPGQVEGTAFVPIHWTDAFTGKARIGALFDPVTDPISGQPESKQAAVSVRALSIQASARLITQMDASVLLGQAAYWAKFRCGEDVWGYTLAFQETPDWDALLGELFKNNLELTWLKSDEGDRKRIHLYNEGALLALLESGPAIPEAVNSRHWQQEWQLASSSAFGRLKPLADECSAPVCACLNVSKKRIQQAVQEGCDTTFALGRRLGCGTRCGSCLPELEELIQRASVKTESDAPKKGESQGCATKECAERHDSVAKSA